MQPIVVSVPHGGWRVAEEVREIWALSAADAFHDGDPLTARIYDFSERVLHQLVMEYYRAVVDLNRAPDDSAPENRDGVIKSHTCYDVAVYRPGCLPGDELKQALLDRYYHPYYRELERCLRDGRTRLGVDCHSMAAVAPPIEADAGTPRPMFCLGNLGDERGHPAAPDGRASCSEEMLRFMVDEFRRAFRHEDVDLAIPAVAAMNVPFSGGRITRAMAEHGVPFVQIEMSRALYLAKPYFDERKLEVDDSRIRDLNAKVWRVLKNTVVNL